MVGTLLAKLRKMFLLNYKLKKALYYILCTPIFTHSSLYKYFYTNYVKKKIPALEKKPLFVIIENTNICNLSCIFCANEQMKRKKDFISEELFVSIIKQCVKYGIPNVLIQGFGEPLLDKDYVKKVQYAKNEGVPLVHCVTNGTLLFNEVSEELIKAGLDYLYISVDAATDQTYGNIHRVPIKGHPSDKFHTVIKNIDDLIDLRKRYHSKKPFIEVRFKDFEVNRHELLIFMKKFSSRVDNVNIYMNIFNWPGSPIKNNLPPRTLLRFPCYSLWSTLYVTYDGRVSLCCQDYECRIEVGDIRYQSLMEIWRGERLKKIRALHLKNRYNEITVCTDCVINSHIVNPWWQ